MRILSKDYRRWSLDAWTGFVRATGATTLTQWAERSRSSYNHAVTLGVQRDVARALGWLPRLEPGEMESMTDAQAAARFQALGVTSMTDMWRSAQPWCEKLRRAGRCSRWHRQSGRLRGVARGGARQDREKMGRTGGVEWTAGQCV